ELLDLTHLFPTLGDDIAILLTRHRRLNSHQSKVCATLLCQLLQSLYRFVVAVVHIWVYRADNNSFVYSNAEFIMQISCSQSDRRKGITAARLHTDGGFFSKLILYGARL